GEEGQGDGQVLLRSRVQDAGVAVRAVAGVSELGITLDRYRLIRKLGAGGMGVVYLAEDEQLRREVVVKTLRDELARDREQVERFFNEARSAARLAHAGIVDVLDVGIAPEGPAYLVMELLA